MKKDTYLDVFNSKDKANDHAIWLNFKYRIAQITFGVIPYSNRKWAVCEQATADQMEVKFISKLPSQYSKMSFDAIRHIRMDKAPLPHWETINGLFTSTDGEILRYILHAKIPLEKLIRFELASRGYDRNHRWVGFEKANEIWLNEN